MNELKKIVENIQSVFAESSYPQDFLDTYDQMECLASHSGRETFLVRNKATGKMAVAKCYDREVFPFRPDPDLLNGLEHPGLPRFFEKYQTDRVLCVVREYVEGDPLNEYVKRKQLTVPGIISIGEQLCEILSALHGHTPPIVHRDIKPENIIVGPEGRVTLIDFDIARVLKEDSGHDTILFGTRGYAPPEQYGFEQTDCRADIYSFGVLLRWLVTGTEKENPNITINERLQRIIDRCTAFSPGDRYAGIGQVRQELRKAERRILPVRRILVLAAALLCALCAGFALGRFTQWLRPIPGIAFSEPLIEQAVRLQLGKETGPLTEQELSGVERILIFGSEAYADPDLYGLQKVDDHARGPLRTLEDLKLLPGLREVCIVRQGYLDVSALADLPFLTKVELKHMRISDLRPVADHPLLKEAILFDCGLTEATALENCPFLEDLDLGLNGITGLDRIGSHPSLRSLCLTWLEALDLNGIAERMPRLRTVTLGHGSVTGLSALRDLKELKTIYVLAEQEQAVREALEGTETLVRVRED